MSGCPASRQSPGVPRAPSAFARGPDGVTEAVLEAQGTLPAHHLAASAASQKLLSKASSRDGSVSPHHAVPWAGDLGMLPPGCSEVLQQGIQSDSPKAHPHSQCPCKGSLLNSVLALPHSHGFNSQGPAAAK